MENVKLVPDFVVECIIDPQKKWKFYPTNFPLCMPLTHIWLRWCGYTLSLTSALGGGELKISGKFSPRENNPDE